MKIVIACDSFKGSLSARDVCNTIKDGILSASPYSQVICSPMADGGEGTVDCFYESCGGELRRTTVSNVFYEPIAVNYLVLPDKTAVIETAAASGITTIDKNRLNPMITSSVGTGETIRHAVEGGAKTIIIGLGGSATNDGGMGILSALGVDFIDENKNVLACVGQNMIKVRDIILRDDFRKFKDINFTLACDVENPFYGENGAAFIFAPQKGANETQVIELDKGLRNLSEIFKNRFDIDIQNINGSGAAGGIAGGMLAVFNCRLESGFSVLSHMSGFQEKIRTADFVFTGEGRTDLQTAFGKLPQRVCELCRGNKIPCILLSGDISEDINPLHMGFSKAYKIKSNDITTDYAMKNARSLLFNKAKEITKGLISK